MHGKFTKLAAINAGIMTQYYFAANNETIIIVKNISETFSMVKNITPKKQQERKNIIIPISLIIIHRTNYIFLRII